MNKRGWIILGIIVLLIFFSLRIYYRTQNVRLGPVIAKTGGFSCSNADGPCQGKSLWSTCENADGSKGVCTGSLTNDFKWNCNCRVAKPITTAS